jgi:hypothetical protein
VGIFKKRKTVGEAPTIDLWGIPRLPSKPGPVNNLSGIFGDTRYSPPIPSNALRARLDPIILGPESINLFLILGLFGYHKIKHRIYLKFHDFYFMPDVNSFLVPYYLCVFAK